MRFVNDRDDIYVEHLCVLEEDQKERSFSSAQAVKEKDLEKKMLLAYDNFERQVYYHKEKLHGWEVNDDTKTIRAATELSKRKRLESKIRAHTSHGRYNLKCYEKSRPPTQAQKARLGILLRFFILSLRRPLPSSGRRSLHGYH